LWIHHRLGEDEEPVWYVPAGLAPSELQSILVVIDQFLETPYDLNGKKASELLSKPRRRRRRGSPSPVGELPSDDGLRKKKKEKKMKEKEQYKSALLIEDSDAEYGDIKAFLEREKSLRERTARFAAENGRTGTMKSTGTKKRRKKADIGVGKKRKGNDQSVLAPSHGEVENETSHSEESDMALFGSRRSSPVVDASPRIKERPRPRPRPRPKPRIISAQLPVSNPSPTQNHTSDADADAGEFVRSAADVALEDSSPEKLSRVGTTGRRRKSRLVMSDDEQ
jgi:replication fork protection complex subunit Tof1/Swi1